MQRLYNRIGWPIDLQDLADAEGYERLEKVMEALEKKDELVQKLDAVTKLTVTAFQVK